MHNLNFSAPVRTTDMPLEDVFPSRFVHEYTEADSIAAFFDEGSWSVSTIGDLDSVPLSALDEHVTAQSTFDSWAAMVRAATDEFAHRSSTY